MLLLSFRDPSVLNPVFRKCDFGYRTKFRISRFDAYISKFTEQLSCYTVTLDLSQKAKRAGRRFHRGAQIILSVRFPAPPAPRSQRGTRISVTKLVNSGKRPSLG